MTPPSSVARGRGCALPWRLPDTSAFARNSSYFALHRVFQIEKNAQRWRGGGPAPGVSPGGDPRGGPGVAPAPPPCAQGGLPVRWWRTCGTGAPVAHPAALWRWSSAARFDHSEGASRSRLCSRIICALRAAFSAASSAACTSVRIARDHW